jgi:hypothetical protein
MENQTFTKKQLVEMGFSAIQVKALVPVDHVKSTKRGRPAALYSQEQVEQLRTGTVPAKVAIAAVAETVTATEAEVVSDTAPEAVTETAPEAPDAETVPADLSDEDFAQAA